MNTQRKWKVGVVGLGVLCTQGSGYARLFNSYPRTEVTAICDVDSGVLEKAGKILKLKDSQLFTNYDEFVNADIDIVVVGTPIPLHAEQAIKAMENGKHVLSEVTVTNIIADCERIVNTVKRTKKTYMMAENYIYAHRIREWKKIFDQEKLGKVYYAEGEYVHEIRDMVIDKKTGKPLWRSNRAPLHYCSHCLGPLLYLMDDRIVKATGSGTAVNIIPNVGVGAIKYPELPEEAKGGHGGGEYYLARDFINALDNNRKPPIDIIKAVDYTIPGIIAHQAAMKGNVWLDVPLFG